jgi:hypothetical protein
MKKKAKTATRPETDQNWDWGHYSANGRAPSVRLAIAITFKPSASGFCYECSRAATSSTRGLPSPVFEA